MMKAELVADMKGSLLQIPNIVGESWVLLIICDANLGVPGPAFHDSLTCTYAGIAILVTVVQLSRDEIQHKKNPAKAGFFSDFGRDNFGRTLHCLVYPPNLSARVESMTKV